MSNTSEGGSMGKDNIRSEAWRNIASGTSRMSTATLTVVIFVAILLGADMALTSGELKRAAEFQAAGASVVTLKAPGRIDGKVCDGFSRVPGVRASGALAKDENTKLKISALPNAGFPAVDVTPGFARLFASDAGKEGVYASREVADMLYLRPGDTIEFLEGDTEIAGIYDYPDDGRKVGLGYAVLVPSLGEKYDECWVDAWPQNPDVARLIHMALLPEEKNLQESGQPFGTPRQEVSLSQLNTRLGAQFDGLHSFTNRITKFVPIIAFLCVGCVAFYFTMRRRLEFASAFHAGMLKRDAQRIVLYEGIPVYVMLFLAGFAVTMCFSYSFAGDAWNLLFQGLVTVADAALGHAVGCFVAVQRMKEEHLFSYFRQR